MASVMQSNSRVQSDHTGCELLWADKAPPSIASHPFAEKMGIPTRLSQKEDGRLPLVLDVWKGNAG